MAAGHLQETRTSSKGPGQPRRNRPLPTQSTGEAGLPRGPVACLKRDYNYLAGVLVASIMLWL
jgi:hypothetical protein